MSANTAPIVTDDTPLVTRDLIIAFVTDDLTGAALCTGLEGTNLEVKQGTVRQATRWIKANSEPLAIIVDVSGLDDPIDALQELSRVCPPDVKVIVIGDRTDMAFYRIVVNEMNASEYLPKPLTRDSVQLILRPKFVGETDNLERGGHVIAFCGAQGGTGNTCIAVNLALLLAETVEAKVAVLDLHLQGGETALMLGVEPPRGRALRNALEDPMQTDSLVIERSAIEITSKVSLIAGDENQNTGLHITETGVRHVIGLLRQRFNYVVIDVPVPLIPAMYPVIELSRHVMVMLEPEITGVRNAHHLRNAVIEIAGKNRVFTVLNRANRPGGLPTPIIVERLGKPDIVIPDLGKGMTQAVNAGIPALRRVPALRRYLAPMVREIAGVAPKRRGLVRRLIGR
jgi:pilus assembly protein CpaE